MSGVQRTKFFGARRGRAPAGRERRRGYQSLAIPLGGMAGAFRCCRDRISGWDEFSKKRRQQINLESLAEGVTTNSWLALLAESSLPARG